MKTHFPEKTKWPAYVSFIAWMPDASTGGFAREAAATIASTKAQHSDLPVASNSRNDRMRDTVQSMAASTQAGEPFRRTFDFG